jgi:hypothetical protein
MDAGIHKQIFNGGRMKLRIYLALSVLVALAGCGTFEVSIERPTDTPIPSSTAVAIQIPASETPAQPAPTLTQPSTSNTTEATQGPKMVEIYLIALEDQGVSGKPVGCGDSAVPVQVQIPPTQGVLRAALDALLALKTQYYGQSGLYNALYQSDLHVESVNIQQGEAIVKLAGTLTQGGECDSPRVQAQLEETVLQFSTVSKASIFINGKPLEDVLSLRGSY